MPNAATLHKAIETASPGALVGISIGSWNDTKTWRLDFDEHATDVQKRAALKALADFDVAAAEVDSQTDAERLAAKLGMNIGKIKAALGLGK